MHISLLGYVRATARGRQLPLQLLVSSRHKGTREPSLACMKRQTHLSRPPGLLSSAETPASRASCLRGRISQARLSAGEFLSASGSRGSFPCGTGNMKSSALTPNRFRGLSSAGSNSSLRLLWPVAVGICRICFHCWMELLLCLLLPAPWWRRVVLVGAGMVVSWSK